MTLSVTSINSGAGGVSGSADGVTILNNAGVFSVAESREQGMNPFLFGSTVVGATVVLTHDGTYHTFTITNGNLFDGYKSVESFSQRSLEFVGKFALSAGGTYFVGFRVSDTIFCGLAVDNATKYLFSKNGGALDSIDVTAFLDGNEHTLKLVWSAATVKLYVDGTLRATSNTVPAGSANVIIGSDSAGGMNGVIKLIRIRCVG